MQYYLVRASNAAAAADRDQLYDLLLARAHAHWATIQGHQQKDRGTLTTDLFPDHQCINPTWTSIGLSNFEDHVDSRLFAELWNTIENPLAEICSRDDFRTLLAMSSAREMAGLLTAEPIPSQQRVTIAARMLKRRPDDQLANALLAHVHQVGAAYSDSEFEQVLEECMLALSDTHPRPLVQLLVQQPADQTRRPIVADALIRLRTMAPELDPTTLRSFVQSSLAEGGKESAEQLIPLLDSLPPEQLLSLAFAQPNASIPAALVEATIRKQSSHLTAERKRALAARLEPVIRSAELKRSVPASRLAIELSVADVALREHLQAVVKQRW